MFWGRISGDTESAGARAQLGADPHLVTLPNAAMFLASAMNILGEAMGFRRSAEADAGRGGDGEALPMFSYSLIEYLMGLDLSGFDLLEVGGGDSTIFWSQHCRSVTAFETDPRWAERVREKAAGADIQLVRPDGLAEAIRGLDRKFGVIVIDPAGNRLHCAREAPAKLAKGGFVLLDNSDWYPRAAAVLREAGLIQVDFHDFRPARPYRATASIFLSPDFRPRPRLARLPLSPIGGKPVAINYWDQD